MGEAEELAFVCRVLRAFDPDAREGCDKDELWWQIEGGRVRFLVNCNDFFWWGTADCERVTPDTIGELERAAADCVAAAGDALDGASLYCCRVRKMRPQGACYRHIRKELWDLFDACGPARAVDLCNPRRHPAEEEPDGKG